MNVKWRKPGEYQTRLSKSSRIKYDVPGIRIPGIRTGIRTWAIADRVASHCVIGLALRLILLEGGLT